jgi:hypothetical protein
LNLIGHQFCQPSYPNRRKWLWFVECHGKSQRRECDYSTIALFNLTRKTCQLTNILVLVFPSLLVIHLP